MPHLEEWIHGWEYVKCGLSDAFQKAIACYKILCLISIGDQTKCCIEHLFLKVCDVAELPYSRLSPKWISSDPLKMCILGVLLSSGDTWLMSEAHDEVKLIGDQVLLLHSLSCPSNLNPCLFLVFSDWEALFSVFKSYILCLCICYHPQNILWIYFIIKIKSIGHICTLTRFAKHPHSML